MTKTAFISGHRDVTDEEFILHYVPKIDQAIKDGDNFVVGDYHGVDIMAQRYLDGCLVPRTKVVVYHMFTAPRNYVNRFLTKGGYIDDEDRDSAMTRESNYDIAWVRKGKEKSGTQINLDRRVKLELENNTYIDTTKNIDTIKKMLGFVENG